jgi:DNA repair exonuclease SbcCD ATPase subunit
MSWSQVEQYQQLEQEYEQARSNYEQAEGQYRSAAAANPNDPGLHAQYEALRAKKTALDELYAELASLRKSLAHATETSPRQATI